MPSIIEYERVLQAMAEQGLICQYYNSGAFGFAKGVPIHYTGWLGPQDPSIRPEALAHARQVSPPFPATLARLATRAWLDLFSGPVWVLPKSQWGYELDFGSKSWLPAALSQVGVDPSPLQGRTDSPAVEFLPAEAARFTPLVEALLENLLASDFALAFPGRPIACTLHSHKQVWWVSKDGKVVEALEALAGVEGER